MNEFSEDCVMITIFMPHRIRHYCNVPNGELRPRKKEKEHKIDESTRVLVGEKSTFALFLLKKFPVCNCHLCGFKSAENTYTHCLRINPTSKSK